jgi:predicted enzyme related to lactoylglutathione lyase
MGKDGNPLARHGALSYLEIPAAAPRESARFYERVLGWHIERRSDDDFRFTGADGRLIGRWVKGRAAAREPGMVPYLYVDAVGDAIARAVEDGGEILEGPVAEGDILIARVRDPGGNLIGLWQFAD